MKKLTAIGLLFLLISPSQAFAGGAGAFENATFSPQALAEANAVTARADEAAAISYNPAGIAYLPGIQAQTDVGFISLITRTKQADSVHYDGGTLIPVPTSYLTVNPGKILNDRLTFGIGADSPFGLVTKYDSNLSSVHYTGYTNILKMYAIKPVAAIKLHEKFSIAAGPIFYRIFDLEQVLAYPNPGNPDGQFRVTGKGHNWGWHMGALAKIHPKHQLGLYFRSPVTIVAKGKIQVERAAFHPNGQYETNARAKFDLPLEITTGYAFLPTDKTSVEVDFTYSRWSSFKRLFVTPDTITNPASTTDDQILAGLTPQGKDYANNFVLHLGGRHKVTDKLTLRLGSYFSWTPIPAHSFTPAVPDSNSLAMTTGFSYAFSKYVQFDLGYLVRYWFQRSVNNDISETLGTTVDGKYSSIAQEFVLGFTYKFDEIFGGKKSVMSSDTSEDGSKQARYAPKMKAQPAPVAAATPQKSKDDLLDAMERDLNEVVK